MKYVVNNVSLCMPIKAGMLFARISGVNNRSDISPDVIERIENCDLHEEELGGNAFGLTKVPRGTRLAAYNDHDPIGETV